MVRTEANGGRREAARSVDSPPQSPSHPPDKLKVKQLNMNTIYVKTEENAASLDVAAPTSAMVQSGTEVRLFFTVIGLMLTFAFPVALLGFNLVVSAMQDDVQRSLIAALTIVFVLSPLYVNWRYQRGLANATFMILRGYLTPFLFIYSVAPENFIDSSPELFIGMGAGFLFLLKLYRRSCKGAPVGPNGEMRVLIIGDAVPPKVDGVATFAENAIERLLRKSHEVHLVTSIAGPEVFYEKCKVTRLPGMTTPISPGHSITLPLPTILAVFASFKPHCVHLFEVSPLNFATFVFCHLADIPVSFSHHTRLDLYINIVTPQFPQWLNKIILYSIERLFYPLSDAHLCVSVVLFEKVKTRGTRNVRFWQSGVASNFDRSKFDAPTRNIYTDGDVQLPLVCHVGRLGPEKNSDEIPDILNETWKIMKGQVRFAIIGGGIMKDQVEREVHEKVSKCHFTGFLRGLPLEQAYASCDVFFSPSTTEGFPLVFLEAMASGLAVVGPIAGGIPDEFKEGVEGCLYDPHDAKSAAKAIKRAIDAGAEMRERAYAKGKAFSWERSINELEDVLKLIVDNEYRSGFSGWWRGSNASLFAQGTGDKKSN